MQRAYSISATVIEILVLVAGAAGLVVLAMKAL